MSTSSNSCVMRLTTSSPAPLLTEEEEEYVEMYGGWNAFMLEHDLDPDDEDDNQEALRKLEDLMAD